MASFATRDQYLCSVLDEIEGLAGAANETLFTAPRRKENLRKIRQLAQEAKRTLDREPSGPARLVTLRAKS